ncbi:hypothetical protein LCGC14_1415710 [marine sediment metagenome]|uniref:Uncharacterized protein n=1 Tax=marine sediment metagenome TaxID=412755 RepID=A0A0F9JTA6_9ZZZZ
MARYKKRPVIVEAEQFLEGQPLPRGVQLVDGYASIITIHNQKAYLQYGDWVIAEPDGIHFYPCKPDIFEQTYEAETE